MNVAQADTAAPKCNSYLTKKCLEGEMVCVCCSEMYHGIRWRSNHLYQASSALWKNETVFVGDFITLPHPQMLSSSPIMSKINQFYMKVIYVLA